MNHIKRYILLVGGLAVFAYWNRGLTGTALLWPALALVPSLLLFFSDNQSFFGRVRALNTLTPTQRGWTAVGVGTISFAFFFLAALAYDRVLFPVWHDDQMHAVQVRMLSTGRLWAPPHPMADFFETFHILQHPVYAPMHFPGTALLNVAGVWLHLSTGIIPLLLVSTGCALTYAVVAKLAGDISGLIAVLMIWASPDARMLATMLVSHNATLALAPLLLWLYLRWREGQAGGIAIALGAAAGLMAITRPLEAIAFALPVGIAILIDTWPGGYRTMARASLTVTAAALPFLFLQLAFDKGVTGHWLTPPYKYYNDIDYPYTSYASTRPDPQKAPEHISNLPQKQDYYEGFMLAQSLEYTLEPWGHLLVKRLDFLFRTSLPNVLFLFCIPAGLYATSRSLPRFVVVAPAILLFLLYLPNIFFPPYYATMVITPMAALALLGLLTLFEAVPSRWAWAKPLSFLAGATGALLAMPPLSTMTAKEFTTSSYPMATFAHRGLRQRVQLPALVLFHYTKGDNYHDEPVYNIETANPDDADIVLAQSLGLRNYELVHYYHDLKQNRHVYVVDRRTLQMAYIGRVDDIDRARPAVAATQPARVPATATQP